MGINYKEAKAKLKGKRRRRICHKQHLTFLTTAKTAKQLHQ
jgi:hypothetical protein